MVDTKKAASRGLFPFQLHGSGRFLYLPRPIAPMHIVLHLADLLRAAPRRLLDDVADADDPHQVGAVHHREVPGVGAGHQGRRCD